MTASPSPVGAAAALLSVLTATADDPALAGLHSPRAIWLLRPTEVTCNLLYTYTDHTALLTHCTSRFGGTVKQGDRVDADLVEQPLTAEWDGLSLRIHIPVASQSVEAQLRARIAELEAAVAAGPAVTE